MIKCCKDCKKRQPHCHNTCEDYLAEKAEWERIKTEMKKEYDFHSFVMTEQKRYKKYAKRYFREK